MSEQTEPTPQSRGGRSRTGGAAAIADHFRAAIYGGRLTYGDVLPAHRSIAAQFGVAVPTASAAMAALKRDGLVDATTSGTVVIYRRVTDTAPTGVAQQLLGGQEAFRRDRTLTKNGRTIGYSVSWIARTVLQFVPELATEDRMPGGWQRLYTQRTGTPLTVGLHSDGLVTQGDTQEAAALGLLDGDDLTVRQVVCVWTAPASEHVTGEPPVVLEVAVDTYLPGVEQ